MVRIDVDVGDPVQPVYAPQLLDHDSAVIEHAEAGGVVPRRVVQAGDRHERAPVTAPQDPLGRGQARSDHPGRRLEHATERRRVATVEPAAAALRALAHEAHVLRGVELLQLEDARLPGLEHGHLRAGGALLELAPERAIAVGAERVAIAEAVAGETLAEHDTNVPGA